MKLDEYKTYNMASEDYFNTTRKNEIPDLGQSYYTFYNYLLTFQKIYEATDIKGDERTKLLTDVFNKSYIVQKNLIEDIWKTCDTQNGKTLEELIAESHPSEESSDTNSTSS
jgi:hypothetical protein